MHDSAESFCGDVCTPIKRTIPSFTKIENNIFDAIAKKFDLKIGKIVFPTGFPATNMIY